jgi:hypothetical protein
MRARLTYIARALSLLAFGALLGSALAVWLFHALPSTVFFYVPFLALLFLILLASLDFVSRHWGG